MTIELINYIIENMRLPKRVLIIGTALLIISGSGAAVALHNNPEPKMAAEQAAASIESTEKSVEPATPHEPEVTQPEEVNEPVVAEEDPIEPEEPAETVDSVLDAIPWNDEERYCLDIVRDLRPEWFADVDTTKKFVSVIQTNYYGKNACPLINPYTATEYLHKGQEAWMDRQMDAATQ